MKRCLIIEGQGVAWSSYYMVNLSTRAGLGTGAIYGTLRSVKALVDKFKPDLLFVCFDKTKSARRRRLYPEYKKHREAEMTEEDKLNRKEFNRQMTELYDGLYVLGIPVVVGDGVESDDCVAVLSHAYKKDHKVTIASNDKDFLQLVDDNVEVYLTQRETVVNTDNFESITKTIEKLEDGISLESWLLYRTLKGDSSDNIPGIKGCGAKTASGLVDGIASIDALVERVKSSNKAVCKKIVTQRDTLNLFWEVMDLKGIMSNIETVNAVYNAVDSIDAELDKDAFVNICKRWEFFSIITEIGSWIRPFQHLARSSP